eukprot:CAMPEP_0196797354 /NCGR_PEP_ID=MMETSP1104-20130614/38599_1 /TAXON_ID=33652 /ORGANISM="Cafeteria sp., Strain Caron Lab Isolate" /LENGTH=849 /DNA_ID=CAMNT_0042167759 /DNA_START=1 /DNA_END=2550 /DNA_ORIENTATION=-
MSISDDSDLDEFEDALDNVEDIQRAVQRSAAQPPAAPLPGAAQGAAPESGPGTTGSADGAVAGEDSTSAGAPEAQHAHVVAEESKTEASTSSGADEEVQVVADAAGAVAAEGEGDVEMPSSATPTATEAGSHPHDPHPGPSKSDEVQDELGSPPTTAEALEPASAAAPAEAAEAAADSDSTDSEPPAQDSDAAGGCEQAVDMPVLEDKGSLAAVVKAVAEVAVTAPAAPTSAPAPAAPTSAPAPAAPTSAPTPAPTSAPEPSPTVSPPAPPPSEPDESKPGPLSTNGVAEEEGKAVAAATAAGPPTAPPVLHSERTMQDVIVSPMARAHHEGISEEEAMMLRNMIVNKDTGEMVPLEVFMQSSDHSNSYTTFDSFVDAAKEERAAQQATEEAAGVGAASKRTSGKMSGMRRFLPFGKKGRKEEDVDDGRVKVEVHKKSWQELVDLRVVQVLQHHKQPVWTMKFSCDGQFLASAGQDTTILVWRVGGPCDPDGAAGGEGEGEGGTATGEPTHAASSGRRGAGAPAAAAATAAPDAGARTPVASNPEAWVVNPTPCRTYKGHTHHVVDLAWSPTNFLLSASADKTVRLWHVSRSDCLCLFQHPDVVAGVDFHPSKDGFFLSGSFDKKLRLWNIPDGRVAQWCHTPEMVSAVAFDPQGRLAVAGLLNGLCVLYQTDRLSYYTQVECRNRHGRLRDGRKVTGISFLPTAKQMLVTTNDSRARLINTDDFTTQCKFKGVVNRHMQIRATPSEDGKRIISGSDDNRVCVWRTEHDMYLPAMNPKTASRFRRDKNSSFESFRPHDAGDTVTVALFAPENTIRRVRAPTSERRFLIVTSSNKGDIKFFESVGSAVKL